MKFTKFKCLKNCENVRIISSNKFYNDSNGRMSIIFEESQINAETKEDFKINSIVRISAPFNAFHGMECQFGKIPQKIVVSNDYGLARFFIVNANPNSDNFGESDTVILNKGSQIYIPEYHFWGFLVITRKCDLTIMTSGIFDQKKYEKIDILDLQDLGKFEKWDFDKCRFGDKNDLNSTCEFDRKLFGRLNEME